MKKKWSNIYLFLIMLGIAFILIAFIYKPATTGKVVNAPDKVSLRGLIASYLFEENVRDNLGNYNGVIKDIIPWTRIEDMNSAPNTKVWKLTKGNSCKISTKNSELTIFTKANEYCSYAINNIVDFSKGFTYEAKVRGLIKNPTMIVSVAEKNMHSDLWLNPRGICLNKNVTCKGLDETQDHVYRITIKNNITKLWVDNIYVGSAPTQISKTKANFIKFGDIAKTPASGSTLIFDYIRHYNKADESPLDYESGKNGKAASFKGISDYVTIPDRLTDGKNQLSISVWVKIDSFSKLGSIISKSNASEERKTELALRTTLDRKIQFELDSPSSLYIVETPQLTPNTWHHIIATYDGSNMKIYANGVLSESRVRHGNLLSINNLDLNIGANSIKTEFFNGAIDELDIYNRALNYSEVQEIYHGNCNIMLNNQNYAIEQDNFNTVLGRSYICYNRNVYSCKEYPNDFAEIKAQNLQQIGSWQCDLNSEQWISIIPRFRSISSSCYYGSNCGPISITSNAKGANIIYEIEWNYHLKNKSIIKNTQDIPFSNAFVETSQIISTESKELVEKITLRVASKSNNQISRWAMEEIPIRYNCTSECDYIGQIQCNGTILSKRKVCGSFSSSNACLTWSANEDCRDNKICLNNQCVEGTSIDTCSNAGGICLNSLLPNTIRLNEDCPAPGYNCYKCNQSKGYAWDPLFLKCIRTGCTNTCTLNRGTCKGSSLENSNINSSLDCCDSGDCYVCNNNHHLYNETCVSNLCLGNLPTTAGQNGTILGPNNFTIGAEQNWTYLNTNTLAACQWKCASGNRRISNETFDGCVEGLPPCETNIGCKNETIADAITIEGNCSTGFQCYQCKTGFNWSNNSCVSTCPNGGCIYNDLCLQQGFRTINSNNQKIYCFNTTMQVQKQEDIECSQNYECITNYCKGGNCTSLLGEIRRTRASTERLICWIRKLFGSSETCS